MVSLLCRWFYNLAIWFYFELSTFLRYLSVLEEKGYRTKEKYLVMVLFSLHLSLKFFKHWITHKNHCIKLSDSIKNIFPILIFFNLNCSPSFTKEKPHDKECYSYMSDLFHSPFQENWGNCDFQKDLLFCLHYYPPRERSDFAVSLLPKEK